MAMTNNAMTTPLLDPRSFTPLGGDIMYDEGSGNNDAAFVTMRTNTTTMNKPRPSISTMAYILISMVLLLIVLFLSVIIMPPTTHSSACHHTSTPESPQQQQQQQQPDKILRHEDPTGIHISLTGKVSEMYVQFATVDSGESIVEYVKKSDVLAVTDVTKNTLDENEKIALFRTTPTTREVVSSSSSSSSLSSLWLKAKGTSTTYTATDMCQEPANRTSEFVSPGHLHTVKLVNLEPNTVYMYRVGLGFGQGIKWNDETFQFRTSSLSFASKTASASSLVPASPALTFLALADQGYNESISSGPQQVAQLIHSLIQERNIDSIHHIGDLCYANGVSSIWDAWIRMIEPYASRVPYMVATGNHEYDHDTGGSNGKDPSGEVSEFGFQPHWDETSFHSTGGECGVPISKRFAVPENGNSVFWYSYDQAILHTVVLSSEHNMTMGSRQYEWLEKDLMTVNRTITPWIVVEMHRPLYGGIEWAEQVQVGMQDEIEDLLYMHRVDVVISGHAHLYYRSCDGLYTYNCGNGGPLFLTVGTGGDSHDKSPTKPRHYTEFTDDTLFGVGRATVYNATVLHWEFIALGENVTDEVWIRRDR